MRLDGNGAATEDDSAQGKNADGLPLGVILDAVDNLVDERCSFISIPSSQQASASYAVLLLKEPCQM